MTDKLPPESAEKIGYVFQLTTNVADGQQLTISGNLALSATKDEMGKEFDKLLSVTGRLAAKHKVVAKKAEIAGIASTINAMKDDLNQLDESAEKKWKGRPLPTVEQNNREAMVRNIRHLGGKKAECEEQLVALEKEAE